jgi:hypothetical protein
MALNKGVEDQLLFDPSKSYFVDPGYTRTSNFQMQVVDVESVNSAAPGQTVQFLLPPSGDVLGALDLSFQFNNNTSTEGGFSAWVETVGYAMIDYVEFTVDSTVLERLTGDQMYIMNELLHPHERATSQVGTTGTSAMLTTLSAGLHSGNTAVSWVANVVSGNDVNQENVPYPGVKGKWNRTIGTKDQTQQYHVPLPFHFTLSPGKFFPMAAVHGINDVRVTMRLRSLEEIVLLKPNIPLPASTGGPQAIVMPKFASGVFKHFRLRAQYYCLSGPQGSALATKEQVRLYHDWQHLRSLKTIKCTPAGQLTKVDIDLNFLHPVKELIMVVRRASEMTNDVSTNIGVVGGHALLNLGPATKNRFAFRGDHEMGDPNIDGLKDSHVGYGNGMEDAFAVHADITNFRLKLNGSERHNNIADGLSREYLHDQIVAAAAHLRGAEQGQPHQARGAHRAAAEHEREGSAGALLLAARPHARQQGDLHLPALHRRREPQLVGLRQLQQGVARQVLVRHDQLLGQQLVGRRRVRDRHLGRVLQLAPDPRRARSRELRLKIDYSDL